MGVRKLYGFKPKWWMVLLVALGISKWKNYIMRQGMREIYYKIGGEN